MGANEGKIAQNKELFNTRQACVRPRVAEIGMEPITRAPYNNEAPDL